MMKLVKCINDEQWDSYVQDSPEANIFCETSFLKSTGNKYELFFVKLNDENHLGAIIVKNSNLFMYQGILFNKLYNEYPVHKKYVSQLKLVDFLLLNLEKKYRKIKFSLHHEIKDLRSFQWFNYHNPKNGQFSFKLIYTGLINLKLFENFDNYLNNIRKVRRWEYRQAIKNKLKVEVSKNYKILDLLHDLTFKRQGIKRDAVLIKNLKNICENFLAQGFGRLLICKNKDNKEISATFFLFDKKTIYYLFGATDPRYRSTGSGTLLMLENIKYAYKNHLHYLDVCGINSPNRGDFKTSFNALPTPYYEVEWKTN